MRLEGHRPNCVHSHRYALLIPIAGRTLLTHSVPSARVCHCPRRPNDRRTCQEVQRLAGPDHLRVARRPRCRGGAEEQRPPAPEGQHHRTSLLRPCIRDVETDVGVCVSSRLWTRRTCSGSADSTVANVFATRRTSRGRCGAGRMSSWAGEGLTGGNRVRQADRERCGG